MNQGRLSRQEARWVERAAGAATGSDCRYPLGAVVVQGGRLIATGRNRNRNVDLEPYEAGTTHAEADALRRARGRTEGATLYVVRVGKGGAHRMAKPCTRCQRALKEAGIAKVVWTTGPAAATRTRIRDL